MTETNPELPSSSESITAAVSETVQREGDIRGRVRDLTLQALRTRRLDSAAIKDVVKAVTEGISLGLDKRAHEVKGALAEAVAGLDDALTKSAEATHLALQQLTSQSKDFTEHDLKAALDDLKRLEEDFLATVSQVADAAGSMIRQEMHDLVGHARRAGTDTGAKVAETMGEFGSRVKATLGESRATGADTVREVSARLATLASGILAGLADALHEKSGKAK